MSDSNHQDAASDKPTGLQDINRFITEAVVQLTVIIEMMHSRISPLSSLNPTKPSERTSGITGWVYSGIRTVTQRVGDGIDLPLGMISKAIGERPLSARQDALVAAINGVFGDHLVKRQSPLAIPMTLKHHGQPLDIQRLAQSLIESDGKLTILIHGLCMSDGQWTRDTHNHGHRLADDLGHTILYLHYNTGRHISDNGRQLNQLVESMVTELESVMGKQPLSLSIVAHSMGGLVARSAHHYARTDECRWPEHLQNIVFLGTPHHGAPLENAGAWLELLLGTHQYTAPLTRISQIRSAGITDLRHGNIIGRPANVISDTRDAVTLPDDVNCYTIAATSSLAANRLGEQMIGDGLVPLDSALGKHNATSFCLQFKPEHQWIERDINHMQLLSDKKVYEVIRHWLGGNVR